MIRNASLKAHFSDMLSTRAHGLESEVQEGGANLSVGERQLISFARVLAFNPDILILDEPTAVLTPQETGEFFLQLKKLKAEGKTVLIITHKLKEIMAVSDRVTVFRAGAVVGEAETAQTSPSKLAEMMVGRSVVLQAGAAPTKKIGEAVLKTETLTVRSGEIVGIAGVEGNGQSELVHALVQNANRSEIGCIPEDRLVEGLLPEASVLENLLLGLQRLARFSTRGWISNKNLKEFGQSVLEEHDIRPRSLTVRAGGLSGGNQQKLIIAREMATRPRFLIAAQPTRGVDVGAIEFIHKKLEKARDEGAGILLVSSDLDEVMALSDRILVMYGGRFVAEFARGACDEKTLGLHMSGVGA
jgi:simple sugar transport system ATP-binding protein